MTNNSQKLDVKEEAKEHYKEIRNVGRMGWMVATIFVTVSFLCLIEFAKHPQLEFIFIQGVIFLMWLSLDGRNTFYNEIRKKRLRDLVLISDFRNNVHGIFRGKKLKNGINVVKRNERMTFVRKIMFGIGSRWEQSEVIFWYFVGIIVIMIVKMGYIHYFL